MSVPHPHTPADEANIRALALDVVLRMEALGVLSFNAETDRATVQRMAAAERARVIVETTEAFLG